MKIIMTFRDILSLIVLGIGSTVLLAIFIYSKVKQAIENRKQNKN